MKLRQFAGLALLLGVVAVIVLFKLMDGGAAPGSDGKAAITVSGVGGGKIAFVNDPDVIRTLKEKYNLTIDFTRVGSLDMVDRCVTGVDFCWPSSVTAAELIEKKADLTVLNSENIFNSPIVMYTWVPIVDALMAAGIVEKSGETYYLVDMAGLIQMQMEHVPWADLGVSNLHGPVMIRTSEPTASNTGNSFAALMANTLNGGQVVNESTVEPVLPQLRAFFEDSGLMPDTTTEIFDQFFTLGMGASPMIVAYESNLIEYCLNNQTEGNQKFIREEVRTLYPSPTVWSSHRMIALTEGGERLIQALRDAEIQRLGWEHHGFRTALPEVTNDTNICSSAIAGVPSSIDSVVQMPNPDTMTKIIDALREELVEPVAGFRRRTIPALAG